jgi:hypothetical protein
VLPTHTRTDTARALVNAESAVYAADDCIVLYCAIVRFDGRRKFLRDKFLWRMYFSR